MATKTIRSEGEISQFSENLNILCDARSKSFRARIESEEILHQPVGFGDGNWCATLGSLRLSYDFKTSINDHILGTRLVNKMIARKDITPIAAKLIDWPSMGAASKYQTSGDRLWLSKFDSGFAATAIQLTYRHRKPKKVSQEEYDNDFRKWKDDRCPIYKLERETQRHILSCTSRRCLKFRKKSNSSLADWFTQQHTNPFISQSILMVLNQDGAISFEDAM